MLAHSAVSGNGTRALSTLTTVLRGWIWKGTTVSFCSKIRTPKIALTLSALLLAGSAWANTSTFTLDQDGCSGTCGLSPFATVTLTENGTGSSETVTVTETLLTGDRYAGTGAGEALEFNVNSPVTITSLSANFAAGTGGASASAFGSFLDFVTCTACQGGKASNPAGPLSFTVGSATGVSIASFIANTGGYFFASDIVGSNGNTGNVADKSAGVLSATPEPGTITMLLSGLMLMGVSMVRRKRAR